MNKNKAVGLAESLQGAYDLDINISYSELGSIVDPAQGTLVYALHEQVKKFYDEPAFVYTSTTGATTNNALMIGATLRAGEYVLIDRGSHGSVYGIIQLLGAIPVYLPSRICPKHGLPLPPSIDDINHALSKQPNIKAVLLTVPSYHGFSYRDLNKVITMIRNHGALCLIDAAHGAHYGLVDDLPTSMHCNKPDFVSYSIHKSFSVLGQAAVLLAYNSDEALWQRFKKVATTLPFGSTSFSVPILASMEVGFHEAHDISAWREAVALSYELANQLNNIVGISVVRVIYDELVSDPTRITLNVTGLSITGYEFKAALRNLDFSDHIVEMATSHYVLLLVSSGTNDNHKNLLIEAVQQISQQCTTCKDIQPPAPNSLPSIPELAVSPRDAFMHMDNENIPIADAASRISAETISCYPPGIPIVVSGERLTTDVLAYLQQQVGLGAELRGVSDATFQSINVIVEE